MCKNLNAYINIKKHPYDLESNTKVVQGKILKVTSTYFQLGCGNEMGVACD